MSAADRKTHASSPSRRMPLVPALEVLLPLRTDQIVISTMGTAREWPKLSNHPLDFHYIPSAMGQAPMLGLGLALAHPRREVLVFNGDGCMLMSLGSLVTVVASGAKNYTLVVLDNGIYEVTGGQATAAAAIGVDFAAMGRAAGFATVATFNELDEWHKQAPSLLSQPGPRLVILNVEPVGADYQLQSPGPLPERLDRFCRALEG